MIYYVGSYSDKETDLLYKGAMPAKLKMDYIINTMRSLKLEFTVYSLCSYVGDKFFVTSKRKRISDEYDILFQFLFKETNKFGKVINRFLKKIEFFFFLFFIVKEEDIVITYHSYLMLNIIKNVHRIKKFKWVTEIEELYSYAWGKKDIREKELCGLGYADAYICVNHKIAEYFQNANKKIIISHGAYLVPTLYEKRHSANEINVVYAGTIEKYKRGAFMAVETARYLDSKWKMHILGFGKEENIKELQSLIDEVNKEANEIKVEYNGKKTGEDLYQFLQNCEVGLSSNIMEADFANHTFPSKAITYLANNLLIVTGYAEMFEKCEIRGYLKFFYEYSPQKIAEVINSLQEQDLEIDGRTHIQKLHRQFMKELYEMVN